MYSPFTYFYQLLELSSYWLNPNLNTRLPGISSTDPFSSQYSLGNQTYCTGFHNSIICLHLFLPPTMIRRSGQSLERATAVDPPTRPVPPNTRTREFAVVSGRGTLAWFSWMPPGTVVLFNCSEAPAISLSTLYSLSLSLYHSHSLPSSAPPLILLWLSVNRWWLRGMLDWRWRGIWRRKMMFMLYNLPTWHFMTFRKSRK